MALTLTFTPPAATSGAGAGSGTGLGWFNALDHGFVADGVTDNAPVWDSFLALVDPNRGGTLYFPQGRYFYSNSPVCTIQGTVIMGEGLPGVGDSLGRGSTQFIVDDGDWGMTFGSPGSTYWRGFGMQNINLYEKNAGKGLGGIKILRANNSLIANCASQFTAGHGYKIDGTGDSCQYNTFYKCNAGTCLTGMEMIAASGNTIFGGFFEGTDTSIHTTIQAGSVAMKLTTSDSCLAFGLSLQGYDTLLDATGILFNEFYGLRLEDWKTQAVRVRTGCKWTHLEGNADNSINSALGSGVVIDPGAEDTFDNIVVRNVTGGARHINNGTRTRYGAKADAPLMSGSTVLSYSASMTPDTYKGPYNRITVTNGAAMTINAASDPFAGAEIIFDFLNSSGGAMGTVTWGGYKLAGVLTNPTNGKRRMIGFRYDGTTWVETFRSTADI